MTILRFPDFIKSISLISVLMLALLLSACSVPRGLLSTNGDNGANVGSKIIIVDTMTGINDAEFTQFFTAIQGKAAVQGFAVVQGGQTAPQKAISIIHGYILNDASAQSVSLVWDLFSPDSTRQKRFSETIPYADLGMSAGASSPLPPVALDSLAALSVANFTKALGGKANE